MRGYYALAFGRNAQCGVPNAEQMVEEVRRQVRENPDFIRRSKNRIPIVVLISVRRVLLQR